VPVLLRQSWYNLNQAFRRRIAHTGVTPDQFTVLRWLIEHSEGTSQRGLADLMSSDANTITSLLTRMEAAGLIERCEDPSDRRRHHICLRDQGRKVFAALQPIAALLQNEVLAAIPSAEHPLFLEHLELMSLACQKAATTARSEGKLASVAKTRRGGVARKR